MDIKQSKNYFGLEPNLIIHPYRKEQVDWLMQITGRWPIASANCMGEIDHYSPNRITFPTIKSLFSLKLDSQTLSQMH